MEREPFRTRARKRIWRETRSFLRGRVQPFFIGIIGIALGFLLNAVWLHKDTARQLAILGAVSLGGSYFIWFLLNLVFNTGRAPWLLDAESNELINQIESRAVAAEGSLQKYTKKEQLSATFGELMSWGKQLFDDMLNCPGEDLEGWDSRFENWTVLVQDFLITRNHHVESVEFVQAGVRAEPVVGIMDIKNKRERRRRIVKEHMNELAQIARRIC